jgi:hypothetical protein
VIAEDISGNNGYVELSFQARKLDDKVRTGCCKPSAGWALLGETETLSSASPWHELHSRTRKISDVMSTWRWASAVTVTVW